MELSRALFKRFGKNFGIPKEELLEAIRELTGILPDQL
jgi:hypothetical protein